MKRSQSLSLVLMGTLMLGTSGCSSDDQETFNAFSNVNECISSGLFAENECREFADAALAQIPAFSNKEECERSFGAGACQDAPENSVQNVIAAAQNNATAQAAQNNATVVRQNTGSSWTPLLMGFMAGRFMGGGGPLQGSQPLFRGNDSTDAGKSFRTPSGETIRTDGKGGVTTPSTQIKQSFTHSPKASITRAGRASSGGFSGSAGSSGGMGGSSFGGGS